MTKRILSLFLCVVMCLGMFPAQAFATELEPVAENTEPALDPAPIPTEEPVAPGAEPTPAPATEPAPTPEPAPAPEPTPASVDTSIPEPELAEIFQGDAFALTGPTEIDGSAGDTVYTYTATLTRDGHAVDGKAVSWYKNGSVLKEDMTDETGKCHASFTASGLNDGDVIYATVQLGTDILSSNTLTISKQRTIVLNVDQITLEVGETFRLIPTVDGVTDSNLVTWSVLNSNIATIDSNGLVTALSEGTTTITAYVKDNPAVQYSCTVHVVAAPSSTIDGTFNGSPAQVDANGNLLINEVNFPDANFRSFISSEYDKENNGYLTPTQVASVKEMNCYNKSIVNLKGIEYFIELTKLSCSGNNLESLNINCNVALTMLNCDGGSNGNKLTALDVSKNIALKELHCSYNKLTSLDVSKNTALTVLYVGGNNLTSLDISNNTALIDLRTHDNELTELDTSRNAVLEILSCSNNNLTALDVSRNTALTTLWCDSNQLTALDVSKNAALECLYCGYNKISTLDLSKNTALIVLNCDDNKLASLDLSKNIAIKELWCQGNLLTSLNLSSNIDLSSVVCGANQLTTLDLSKNSALRSLTCSGNELTTLDVSKNAELIELHCFKNQLTELDLSTNTKLSSLWCYDNQLTALELSKNTALNSLRCYNNQLTSLDLSKNNAIWQLECYQQSSTADAEWDGNIRILDMAAIVDEANIGKVTVASGGTYDPSTGIVTLTGLADDAESATVVYNYDTASVLESDSMDVTLSVSIPEKPQTGDKFEITGPTEIDSSAGDTVYTYTATLTRDGHAVDGKAVSWYKNGSVLKEDMTDETGKCHASFTASGLNDGDVIYATVTLGTDILSSNTLTISKQRTIVLNVDQITLEVGETFRLIPTVDGVTDSNLVTWSVLNSNIATIDSNGLVTALSEGTTTITAYVKDNPAVQYSCTVYVVDSSETVISIQPVISELKKNQVINIRCDVTSESGAGFDCWRIDDESQGYYSIANDREPSTTLTALNITSSPVRLYAHADDGTSAYIEFSIVPADSLQLEANPGSIKNGETSTVYVVNAIDNEEFTWNITPSANDGVLADFRNLGSSVELTAGTAVGSITVSATSKIDQSRTASVTVYVNPGPIDGTFNGSPAQVDANGNLLINEANFPDANFRSFISSEYDKENNGYLTPAQVASVKEMNCYDKSIVNLKGIEYFIELTKLICSGNNLESLNISCNVALTMLNCDGGSNGNKLTALDVSKNIALKELHCSYNKLTSLDVSKNTALTVLYVGGNNLTSLDVSRNTALTTLWCDSNQLTSLDVSKNTVLTELNCHTNQLISLDVNKNTLLTRLVCSSNALNELNIDNNTALESLLCGENQLSTLDVSNNTSLYVLSCNSNNLAYLIVDSNILLESLNCNNNRISYIDVTENTALTFLDCGVNNLSTLDVSNNIDLEYLLCTGNKLTTLDVSKNTALTTLWCNNNQLTTLDVSRNTALWQLECSQQSSTVDAEWDGNIRILDMAAIVGEANIGKVTFTSGGTYDSSTGIVTLTGLADDAESATVVYNYDTASVLESDSMDVTLSVSIPEKPHTGPIDGTFNGSPAQVDADGNLLINEANFPDANFRSFISKNYDGAGKGYLTSAQVAAVNIMGCAFSEISNLKGIEYFTAVTILFCNNNQLTNLDVSRNTALVDLLCSYNRLTSLDVSKNTRLKCLDCRNNELTTLDVTKNTALEELYCTGNKLATLDLSHNTALTILECIGQSPVGTASWLEGRLVVDMTPVVGQANLGKVSAVQADILLTPGSYDSSTGIFTFDELAEGTEKAYATYHYDTGSVLDIDIMLVGLEVEVPQQLKATSIAITAPDGSVFEKGLDYAIDMAENPTYKLGIKAEPDSASRRASWKSSSSAIATVDENGLVSFLKPGTVTITATAKDGSRKSATVKFVVDYKGFGASQKLTASLPEYSLPEAEGGYAQPLDLGLQLGDKVQMSVFGADKTAALEPALLEFSVKPVSNGPFVSVDEKGVIKSIKPGGAGTVVASLKGDPLGRSVSLSVKTIGTLTGTVYITPYDEKDAAFVGVDANGNICGPESELAPVSYAIMVDHVEKTAPARTYRIRLSAEDVAGNPIDPVKGKFTWASSATGIATVKENPNGSVYITVKSGADGACSITATSKDKSKAQGSIAVYVREYSPRLSAASVTLDSQKENSASLLLVESYDNAIIPDAQGIKVAYYDGGYDRLTKNYTTLSENFELSLEGEVLTIKAKSYLKNQTVKGQLLVNTKNGSFRLPLNIVVKNVVPTVTVKQLTKLDLFSTGSKAEFAVSVKDDTVTTVELVSSDFAGAWNGETLTVTHLGAENPDKKAVLKISLASCENAVEKAVSIGTVSTKPSLSLEPGNIVLNTALGEDSVLLRFYNKTAKAYVDLNGAEISFSPAIDIPEERKIEDNTGLRIKTNGSAFFNKGGNVTVSIKAADWSDSISLNGTVKVIGTKPKAKLSAATLNLNSLYPSLTAQTALTLDHANCHVSGVESAVLTAVKPNIETAKLSVSYANGFVTAKITDKTIQNGSYAFHFEPEYKSAGGSGKLAEVKVTVKVGSTAPAGKLEKTSLNLSSNYIDQSAVTRLIATEATAKANEFYVKSITPRTGDAASSPIGFDINGAEIKAYVKSKGSADGNYVFDVVGACKAGEDEVSTKAMTLTVKLTATKPAVKFSASTVNLNLNKGMPGAEKAFTLLTSSTKGYTVTGSRAEPQDSLTTTMADRITVSCEGARVSVRLKGTDPAPEGSYKYKVYPTVRNDTSGEAAECAPVVLTVKVYTNAKLGVAVSAKGKIDAAVYGSFIEYTVTKLTNVAGAVESVKVSGTDAALFDAELGEENAKGQSTIKLRLKDGAKVATNKSYKIKLAMTLEGDIPVSTNELTVRISAGNLKLKAEPASQSFFQSQNRYREVSYKLSVTAPEGARIGRVELGSVGILRRTLVNADTNVIPEISQDGKSVTVRVILKDTSTLSAGKNYTLPLEVYAKGNVENPKPVKINLSLKVLK